LRAAPQIAIDGWSLALAKVRIMRTISVIGINEAATDEADADRRHEKIIEGVSATTAAPTRNGVPLLAVRDTTAVVSLNLVNALRDNVP
jgi:hypothetical protein